MSNRNAVMDLRQLNLSNAEIARRLSITRERVAQIIGKSPEAEKKAKARKMVKDAIKQSFIIKQPCFRCGSELSEAHHEDYDKPLEVVWVCKAHHREIHKTDGKYIDNASAIRKYPTFSIAKSKKREKHLGDAADLSTDPDINGRADGWRTSMIDEALEFYIRVKTEKKTGIK